MHDERSPAYYTLVNFFKILGHTWFLWLFLVLNVFALNGVEQAEDTVTEILTENRTHQAFFMYACTTLFALAVWYAARIMFFLARIDFFSYRSVILLVKWLPRVMGALAYLALIILLIRLAGHEDAHKRPANLQDRAACHLLITAGIVLCYFVFVVTRRNKASVFRFRTANRSFHALPGTTRITIRLLLGLMLALVAVCCVRPWGSALACTVGALSVITLAMAVYSVGGMVLLYWQKRLSLPLALIVYFFTVVFSFFNDNHGIRTLGKPSREGPPRPGVQAAFRSWMEDTARSSAKGDYPVFIVSAEGGGIRAACFTALLLARFDSAYAGFTDHVFALSSVSGGSLGAVVYNALRSDPAIPNARMPGLAASFFKEDFLAPLNSAFVFPDVVQKFCPVPIGIFDRARWLEDAWSRAWPRDTGRQVSLLDSAMSHLRRIGSRLPYLFINTTCVESGQKAILSELALDSVYFRDDMDLMNELGTPVALKTVASMSARFPFITPAAKVRFPGKDVCYHFVDGGYVDNSGLGTAASIAGLLNEVKQDSTWTGRKDFTVYIILLKNSLVSEPKPIRGLYETRAVISAFYNAWDNNVNRVIKNAENYFAFNKAGGQLIPLAMNRQTGIVPLGWDLSVHALGRIDSSISCLIRDRTIPGLIREPVSSPVLQKP